MDGVTILIRGKHNTGRTTLASFMKMVFEECGYRKVSIEDTEPLPHDVKADWPARFSRNRERPISIKIETLP